MSLSRPENKTDIVSDNISAAEAAARKFEMGVISWSPLSGGWLTGKYTRANSIPKKSRAATNPDHLDIGNELKFGAVERLEQVASEAGLSLTHLALAWARCDRSPI